MESHDDERAGFFGPVLGDGRPLLLVIAGSGATTLALGASLSHPGVPD